MDSSLKLRVGAVFIMLSCSLAGVVLPLHLNSSGKHDEKVSDSRRFRIIRAFASGVMLGVGFIHLLNDGVNKLASVCIQYPSLGFTLATVGTMIVLGFEQIAVMLISSSKTGETKNLPHLEEAKHNCSHAVEEMEVERSESTEDRSSNACDHNHGIHMIASADSTGTIIKAYMMEISVAIHSVIIGITVGSLSGSDNIPTLRALIVAISFHQFFEGLGLGTVIEAARLQLGFMKIIIFTLTFAATVPVGIMIGILLTMNRTDEEGPTDAELYITGSLNSIAAGILIYVAMVEMIAEDFQEAKIATNIGLKVQMFAALMIGTLFMAVLAIWA
jgi:solute carrier family 39 (zinc transporter), member 1/2/3